MTYTVLRFSGLPLLIRETIQRRATTIVLLHDPDPVVFERQVAALKRRYSLTGLQDYLEWRAKGATDRMPAKSLIVTFDDGHRRNADLYETVRSEDVPATVFLCSGIVGTHRRFWFEHGLPESEVQALKRVSDDARLEALRAHGFSDEAEFEPRQALSQDELDELKVRIDFQSHTVTHPILPNCSDAKLAVEVDESKRALEARGLRINTLSYPNGDYGDRELAALERAGYTCGITVDVGFNTSRTDLLRLRRIAVDDDASPTELIVKASGLIDLLKWPVRRVATRRRRSAARGTVR